jgi:DNA-binding response OmpR family regulator
LLIEDDGMVRETIAMMLEEVYDTDIAASVSVALAILRAPGPIAIDVMLVDCLLPDGDPADILVEADRRAIPVVLISGDPSQVAALDPQRRFLPKPFTRARLLATLDTARG